MMILSEEEAGETRWEAVGGGGVVLINPSSTHNMSGCTVILVEIPCLNGRCGGYIGSMEGQ